MRSIQPFIQRKTVVLRQGTPVREAARAMREERIGCVPVSDHQGHIVGIVTDRDLVSQVLAEGKSPDTPLSEAMTRSPVLAEETADLNRVIASMEEHGIRRVPVIERLGGTSVRCVGIVTLDDLIAARAIDFPHLMRIVRSQVRRRYARYQRKRSEIEQERIERELESFAKAVSSRLGPRFSFRRGEIEQLAETVLSAIVRRLHHTGAMHLISELPEKFQATLLELPPGPDPTIRADSVVQEIARLFEVGDPAAREILRGFLGALEDRCDPRQLDQVKAQLPRDFVDQFPGRAAEAA